MSGTQANATQCCTPGTTCCGDAAETPTIATNSEMTLQGLVALLETARGADLRIAYQDRTTKPGYHITELKYARVTGLDCSANVESWDETTLQVWDIAESVTGEHMTVNKLLGIIKKVQAQLSANPASRTVFEVSDGIDPIQIFAFDRLDVSAGTATIHLNAHVSACKPLVRGMLNACAPKQGSGPVRRPPSATCCG